MNWEAAGAIGEILGAVGVIITLAYLSIQIRASTRATQVETADRILARVNESQGRLVESEELTALVRRGARSMESLESDERMRVRLLFFEMLRNSEQAVIFHRQGALDQGMFDRWYRSLLSLLARWPELATYLSQNRDLFDDAFVEMCFREAETGPARAPGAPSHQTPSTTPR